MIPENNPLDRPKVDRGSHKERARVKADAARTLANIDNLLAGGSGRVGVADIDKIFPTTPEDDADYERAEAYAKENFGSHIGPGTVAARMGTVWTNDEDRQRYVELEKAADSHLYRGDKDQHRAAVEAMDETYRRGVRQVGSQTEYDVARDLGLVDEDLVGEIAGYEEPERTDVPTNIIGPTGNWGADTRYTFNTFSTLYSRPTGQNRSAAEAQDEWYGAEFPRSTSYGDRAYTRGPGGG